MKSPFVLPFLLFLVLSSSGSWLRATEEITDAYSSVSCLAKGNACVASVSGFASHFYNPAAVGRFTRSQWEGHLVVAEGHFNSQAISHFWDTQSLGPYQILKESQNSVGKYHFESISTFPSLTFRNFSFGILGTSQINAVSDGTQLNINSRQDLIPTLSLSRHFAGNLLRVGLSVKGILRNQIKGTFTHSSLLAMEESQYASLGQEGFGASVEGGLLLTLPHRYLPTFGVAWLNAFDTHFSPVKVFSTQANTSPEKIPQSFHAGFSINPKLNRSSHMSLSADFRHIELAHLPLRKKLHFGLEIKNSMGWYFWGGLNQLYVTGGLGLRLPGGHLEMGTYASDRGTGETLEEDRRYFLRYTMSFGT